MLHALAENRHALVRYVTAMAGGDEDVANDAVQEALLKLWRAEDVVDEEHARRWLYRTARNLALDRVNQRSRRAQLRSIHGGRLIPEEPAADPLQALEARRLAEVFYAELADLPQRQQEIVRLRLLARLSYRDIAAVLNTTTNNVGVQLHAAVKRLQVAIKEAQTPPTDPKVLGIDEKVGS